MKQRNVSSDEEDLQKAVQDLGLVVLGKKMSFFENFDLLKISKKNVKSLERLIDM